METSDNNTMAELARALWNRLAFEPTRKIIVHACCKGPQSRAHRKGPHTLGLILTAPTLEAKQQCEIIKKELLEGHEPPITWPDGSGLVAWGSGFIIGDWTNSPKDEGRAFTNVSIICMGDVFLHVFASLKGCPVPSLNTG